MAYVKLCILSILAAGALVAAQDEKQGKVWSLFSVVSFKNVPCRSESGPATTSGINRNGTCFTSSECTSKGGKASGNCAAGFGVCCLFTVTSTSNQISINNTYIQNPGYPTVLSTTTALAYTVKKCADNICMLRLDFEQFTIEGLSSVDEQGVCRDSFAVTTSVKTITYPVICGVNAGQHMYIDMTRDNGATATLTFTFDTATASTKRTWDIKVAQIECDSKSKPYDSGCLQYLSGTTGRFSSFNFQEPTAALQHHLPTQGYSICIRQEADFCCIEYSLCSDTNSWFFEMVNDKAHIDSMCTQDFLGITGGQTTCNADPSAPKDTRVCGGKFSFAEGDVLHAVVCDCTAPFTVDVRFDDKAAAAEALTNQRGFCLEYKQRAC